MKIQNKGAVLVQIAPLFISQPRNQNQSIDYMYIYIYNHMHIYINIHIHINVHIFFRRDSREAASVILTDFDYRFFVLILFVGSGIRR